MGTWGTAASAPAALVLAFSATGLSMRRTVLLVALAACLPNLPAYAADTPVAAARNEAAAALHRLGGEDNVAVADLMRERLVPRAGDMGAA